MFNGMIKYQAKFLEFNKQNNTLKIELIDISEDEIKNISLGDSIACNGICLTVVKIEENIFFFNIAPETILQTNIINLKQDDHINIEFPMRVGDKIDGHLNYGHIYGTAKLIDISENNIFLFETKNNVFQYLDYKSPVTINGIALTISNIYTDKNQFDVNIIPFTLEKTNLRFAKINDVVNIEPDILAVYTIGIVRRNGQ
jgi:riboflavin synthase